MDIFMAVLIGVEHIALFTAIMVLWGAVGAIRSIQKHVARIDRNTKKLLETYSYITKDLR